jgi:hypothetical protein
VEEGGVRKVIGTEQVEVRKHFKRLKKLIGIPSKEDLDKELERVFSEKNPSIASVVKTGLIRKTEAEALEKKLETAAISGTKILRAVSKGGKARKVSLDSMGIWQKVQKEAEAIWDRNPELSKTRVGEILEKSPIILRSFDDLRLKRPSASTIRQKIKKPL